ncbi:MAG: hypothetical protein K6B40_03260 [Firmicutes bacterium]|nr:hypothetical protein [Bacillota bacterium]
MKKWIAFLLALCFIIAVAACSGDTPDPATATPDGDIHKIGVIVYNTADEEVNGFRQYLQGYIAENFDNVQFLYSGSIRDEQEEQAFIKTACEQGAEGFLSFLSHDLRAEVETCAENHVYYLLASGTVADEDFEAVANNPWFLGTFGPGQPFEFQAGADMARFFLKEETGNRYFILSGGAPFGNEMHYQRTWGILDTLTHAYGVSLPQPIAELLAVTEPVTVETERLTVTVCPGYISREDGLQTAKEAYAAGAYDAVLSVLPPENMIADIGDTPLGIVDSYNTRNLQLFISGPLQFCVGKYSSMIGPAFALMLNAVTGYAEDFREKGRAIRVTQGFWTSDSLEDYTEKYALSSSAAMNAYNFDDLSQVIRIYNPDATLNDLAALAEACSYRAVLARRGK